MHFIQISEIAFFNLCLKLFESLHDVAGRCTDGIHVCKWNEQLFLLSLIIDDLTFNAFLIFELLPEQTVLHADCNRLYNGSSLEIYFIRQMNYSSELTREHTAYEESSL